MSWEQYLAIVTEAREEAAAEHNALPTACPNDGEPLISGPHGGLYCPFDGWTP